MATSVPDNHNHNHSHENGAPKGSNDAAYPAHWQKNKIPAHLRPQKFNSTSSLYIDSTISKPKNAELMHCIAVYFVKQIKDPSQHNKQDKTHQNNYSIFDESVFPLTSKNVNTVDVPSVETVEKLVKSIFKIGQLAPESLIMAVAYLERINRLSNYRLFAYNWKRTLLSTLILASKVWEDQAVWNVDFIELFPLTTPSDLGQLEKKMLALLGFDVSLKASEYAQIYFDIRAQAAHHCSDEHFLELKPLNKDNEDKLELRSQNYTLAYAKKLYRSSGSVDDIGMAMKSPRSILN